MGFKSHILKKKHKVSPGSRVDPPGRPGWAGHCTGWFFDKPGLVQLPGRPTKPVRI